jgi:thiamine biosynthesis lipoprotein
LTFSLFYDKINKKIGECGLERDNASLKNIISISAFVLLTAVLVIFLINRLSGGNIEVSERRDKHIYGCFDTICSVYGYSNDTKADFEENCRLIEERLDYYHKLFDIYNEYDGIVNVATVNRLAGEREVEIPSELLEFLRYSVSMHELTDGNVNIAMGRVLSLWHQYREEGNAVPTKAELSSASEHTDINDLMIDTEKSIVRFADPELLLDVGAIAKGYTAEKCAELLLSRGVTSYVLDFGGNLRIVGKKPDGGSWRTGVKNPDMLSEDAYVYYLDVADTSVVTSGDYQRFYIVDGNSYHHIINKDTLFPAEYYSSVSVICENSGLADALSTALFNMEMADAVALLDTLDGVSVVWVYPDGEIETYGLDD